jgi:outer membrane protein assembly factor BamB
MGKLLLTLLLSVALGLPCPSWAAQFPNSLWLGTDNTDSLPVLNTDRTGTELRRVDTTEATGIAIDAAANRIYFGVGTGGQITGRDLNTPATTLVTLNPATGFGEDMAFDGAFLWRANGDAQVVQKIDPSDGSISFSFDPGFIPLGIAWDGSNLWVSKYDGFAGPGNELVKQFTPEGVATGNEFNAPLGGNFVGGLAFDTTDNTLWIGTFNEVVHSTTTGTFLGSFAVPGRFIDGLEFQGDALPVGGAVTGMSPMTGKVTCRNLTTKKNVKITLPVGVRLWDCEQAGLVVNPGDKIKQMITVTGPAD